MVRSYLCSLASVLPRAQNITKTQKPWGYIKNRYISTRVIRKGGYKINTLKTGQGQHAVFLIPGILGCMEMQLQSTVNGLDKNKFTIYAWDQPGYGESRPPERICDHYSIREDAKLLSEFLKELGHEQYSIFGWSGGGQVAILTAIANPELIQRLVVLGTWCETREKDVETFQAYKDIDTWAGSKMQKVLVDYYGNELFSQEWKRWMDIYSDYYVKKDGDISKEELAKIQCPTLIIHGDKDPIIDPYHGPYLHKHIKNSRLVLWKKGSHNVHIRFPEEFNRTLEDFYLESRSSS